MVHAPKTRTGCRRHPHAEGQRTGYLIGDAHHQPPLRSGTPTDSLKRIQIQMRARGGFGCGAGSGAGRVRARGEAGRGRGRAGARQGGGEAGALTTHKQHRHATSRPRQFAAIVNDSPVG
ncbi:hypothetical protein Acsp01_06740 [Actinoplanes sp. NBRC 101535]|nr:hypothetical protein Acsp01_06740 [Actinoplanes sp. NBRC 101535]